MRPPAPPPSAPMSGAEVQYQNAAIAAAAEMRGD